MLNAYCPQQQKSKAVFVAKNYRKYKNDTKSNIIIYVSINFYSQ